MCFFFSSRRRHTRWTGDWSSDVCSSDLTSHDGICYIKVRDLRVMRLDITLEVSDLDVTDAIMRGAYRVEGRRLWTSRSEERRVGKECRSWRSRCDLTNKVLVVLSERS